MTAVPLTLTDKDKADAVCALIDWFQSQDIPMQDALPILGTVLSYAIIQIAEQYDKDPVAGGRAACRGIMEAVKLGKNL